MTTATKKTQKERLAALEASIAGLKREYGISTSKTSFEDDYDDEPSFFETDIKVSFWATVIGVVFAALNDAMNS
jgi:hypothetical protein